MVTSKSSFLLEGLERRISRGYCSDVKPGDIYVCVYTGPEVQSENMK